ncbi:MAG: hypothetical protein V8T10_10135 [Merdibacter sp.]
MCLSCIDERVKTRDVVTIFADRHMADDDPAGEFRRVKHEMRIGHHFAEVAAEVRFVHDAGMGEDAAVIINDLRQGIHPGKLFCIVLVQQIAEAFHVGMGVDRDMQGIGHLMQDARFALQEHLMEKAQVISVPDALQTKSQLPMSAYTPGALLSFMMKRRVSRLCGPFSMRSPASTSTSDPGV